MTLAYVLTAGIIVATILGLRLRRLYRDGRLMEKSIKNAMLAILARLDQDLGTYPDDVRRNLATAILFRPTSTKLDGRGDSVEAFCSRNCELVETETSRLMASDSDLREITIQTQRFLYFNRKFHGLHSSGERLLDNTVYRLHESEYPVIPPVAYLQLVSDFYRKLTAASSQPKDK